MKTRCVQSKWRFDGFFLHILTFSVFELDVYLLFSPCFIFLISMLYLFLEKKICIKVSFFKPIVILRDRRTASSLKKHTKYKHIYAFFVLKNAFYHVHQIFLRKFVFLEQWSRLCTGMGHKNDICRKRHWLYGTKQPTFSREKQIFSEIFEVYKAT